MQHIFGTISMVCAVLMVLYGLPMQIRKNMSEKRSGQPIALIATALVVYASRFGYGVCIKSVYIALPDLLGLICSVILLRQHFAWGEVRIQYSHKLILPSGNPDNIIGVVRRYLKNT